MKPRHAEIAGAGIGGLTAAASLAQRGWSVTVHERAPEIRAFGAGIFIYENGLRVLKAIGALHDVIAGADPIRRRETHDRVNRLISVAHIDQRRSGRVITILRQRLIGALRAAAERAGVEIVTSSTAVRAAPNGELELAGEHTRKADLVIGADGVNSKVRDSLDLVRSRKKLADGAIRLLVERSQRNASEEDSVCHEYFSGARRVISVPCSRDHIYVGLCAPVSDESAKTLPVRRDTWKSSFPHLADLIDRIGDQGRWDQFETIKLRRWSMGRVAIIGDAAHAHPPNLGQGGGCAMMSALGLSVALDRHHDVETALDEWERRERPIVEHTQRISMLYGALTAWPPFIRFHIAWLNRQRLRTALHVPTGTA